MAGLQSSEVTGVENKDGDIAGCMRHFQMNWVFPAKRQPDVCVIFKCTGVFPAKRQECSVCDFNTVLPFKKKKKVYRFSQTL